MKLLLQITTCLLCIGYVFSTTSCLVVQKHDNGHHRGWNKQSVSPGHSNGHHHGKGKGNKKH